MYEKCDFNEKGRAIRSYLHLRTKTLEDLMKKTTKILDWIGQGENSEKGFEKVKSMRRENLFLKITVSISIG